ncbi:MAG: hypothetical protein H6706_30810 [Myxococcales bacterium]|nr:hypothetical protein [Myxococcales bacterium]
MADAEAPTDAAPPPDAAAADLGVDCIGAELAGGLTAWDDGPYRATVEVDADGCARRYRLRTTQPLRDNQPQNPRTIEESSIRVRTSSPLFDALYALALAEADENAVDAVRDGAFSNGQPVPCLPGGCFETGRLWHYVWTRDTAYAVALGLASLDPQRAQNSLDFKLSAPTAGGPPQVMQDTGTGGSHPISTDRVIWALGARTLLAQLEGERRAAFARRAFDALRATAEHDRAVAFDADGLYRGEQSFLDWREQTYPAWTAGHVAHIGMSRALSTNIAHLIALSLLADLAAELGEPADAWRAQAEALRGAIRDRFWLPEAGLFSTFITTTLDPAPAAQFDLLGNALAILEGVATGPQAASILARYPHLAPGAPVIWPQQQFTPIYHNRGQWPFVTAFWLRAGLAGRHGGVVTRAVDALVRGAALNLSNMENFEAATGLPYVEEGPTSGPVVNSQRQLWSVAAYLTVVHEALFGLHPHADGLRLAPALPAALWAQLFGDADRAVLEGYPYRGRRLTLIVRRPGSGPATDRELGPDEGDEPIVITAADLPEGPVTTVDAADYRDVFAPRVPAIPRVTARGEDLVVALDAAGEADVRLRVYRDGEVVADALPAGQAEWIDAGAAAAGRTRCYTVESAFASSGNTSQRADPYCWWGPPVLTFDADRLTPIGGRRADAHGRRHVEVWADQGQAVALDDLEVPSDGEWLIQVVYGNGAASVTTGITCGHLRVRVLDEAGGEAGRGYLPLPHTGDWATWRDSGFVAVRLRAGSRYRVVLDGQEHAYNMSIFEHFRRYTGGPGGADGVFNRANISALKLLGR